MGLWARSGRLGRAAALLGVGVAGGGAAVAVATVPDSGGVIHACYATDGSGAPTNGGAPLTVIDPSAGQSCSVAGAGPGRRQLDWNAGGPQGPQGPPGPPGPSGGTATVLAGHTLTLSGGQVVTVGGEAGGVTVSSLVPNFSKTLAEVHIKSQNLDFPIEALSMGKPSGGNGRAAARAQVHDISLSKKYDKASATIFKLCASGQPLGDVTITFKKGKKVYLEYKLSSVLVSSYQQASGKNGKLDSFTLNFASIKTTYHP